MTGPNYPELRHRIRDFAAGRWGEPDGVVLLGRVRPDFEVPGRRGDGTIVGKRLIRRFFWNVLRGVGIAIGYVIVFLLTFEGPGGDGKGSLGVRGPANALALGMVDAAMRAKRAWLVYSNSYAAVLDSGSDHSLSGVPTTKVLWHVEGPDVPKVNRLGQVIKWRDGSEYSYILEGDEGDMIRKERKEWLWRDRRKD